MPPCPCTDYRPKVDQNRLRAQLLAAGRVNARASDLYDEIVNALSTTIRDLCETRGILVTPDLRMPALMALWLADSVSAIAASDGAGETFDELYGLTGRIEKVIDRPEPPRFVGPCPSPRERPDGRARECGTALRARRQDTHVRCPVCKSLHNIESLTDQLVNRTAYHRYSLATIYRILVATAPDDQPMVPRSTFYAWCKKAREDGRLKIKGYQRPKANPDDPNELSRIVINRHSAADEPLYLVSDVRRVVNEKPARKVRA
jgi:hypothetical protein